MKIKSRSPPVWPLWRGCIIELGEKPAVLAQIPALYNGAPSMGEMPVMRLDEKLTRVSPGVQIIPHSPTDDYIREAILAAQKVWTDWGDAFEHVGDVSSNPILADSGRFNYFCNEWSVARTIRAGTSDDFRRTLRDSREFALALDDPTGRTLDRLHENTLRPRFGTQGGKRGVTSALSKIATFVRPEVFTAWDRFALAGLNIVTGRSKSRWFENYADYLSMFNRAWNGACGERIREATNSPAGPPKGDDLRFQRRVLDLYLMREGGYSHEADISDKRTYCR